MLKKQILEIWSDLNPNLITDGQGKLKKDINIIAVKGSIDNILRTSPGERVMLPEFALGLKQVLFEPINDSLLNKVVDGIKNAIEIWDDRVLIEGVELKLNPDLSSISVNLTFRIKSFYEVFNHTVVINP
jgi:phage baseplate assembly protein W